MNTEREYVFEQRDLEVMQTAAGQVSVAVENARLFAEEQRRSRQLAFLNNISKTAISSEDSEQMLADIVGQIQKNFSFDHIGIGILDYVDQGDRDQGRGRHHRAGAGQTHPAGSGHSRPGGADRRSCAGADHERSSAAGRVAGSALRALHPDCLRREPSRRAQCGEPEGRCLHAAGPADHEHAGRPAGHCSAQCVRLPETAAAIHHRRADAASRRGGSSSKR